MMVAVDSIRARMVGFRTDDNLRGRVMVRKWDKLVLTIGIALLAGCGPSPEEARAMQAAQRASDQERCAGFGFTPQSPEFANCMMQTANRREAREAADQRAAADRAAADQRSRQAADEARRRADQDAWDRRTGQGRYANQGSSGTAPDDPARHGGVGGMDTSRMNCVTHSSTSGTPFNQHSESRTECHN